MIKKLAEWGLSNFGSTVFLWTTLGALGAAIAFGGGMVYYKLKYENTGLKLESALEKNEELAGSVRQAEKAIKGIKEQVGTCEAELKLANENAGKREEILTNAKTVPVAPKQASKEVLDDASSTSVLDHLDGAFGRLRR